MCVSVCVCACAFYRYKDTQACSPTRSIMSRLDRYSAGTSVLHKRQRKGSCASHARTHTHTELKNKKVYTNVILSLVFLSHTHSHIPALSPSAHLTSWRGRAHVHAHNPLHTVHAAAVATTSRNGGTRSCCGYRRYYSRCV